MKFAGLILICASSCLALLLPAIGVVKFPKVENKSANLAPAFPPNASAAPGHPISSNAGGPNWLSNPVAPTGELLPGGLPPSFQSSSAATSSVPFQTGAADNSGGKLGMGVWLLLGPVCLLGLALWTFSPNPTSPKSHRS